ncbi:Histone H2B [Mycena sanguinolenta]|uniref:Histone H2B n=1 Tax=Mycena sanguinolenta TaxID=230812 RepID=A0A8H6YRZ5_9AGAR|nr:Histone H2B [Mycena sanguinolenta]
MARPLNLLRTRFYSSRATLTPANIQALDEYIAAPKKLVLEDTFNVERVSDLFITLPTRDGTRKPYTPPRLGSPCGIWLASGVLSCSNPGKRMWASGRMSWNSKHPLLVGKTATSSSTFGSVEKKGFDTESPMVFVTQRINITMAGETEPSITEERSHVYMGESVAPSNIPRVVKNIPLSADFTFKFTPSLITPLSFLGPHSSRGYPERLVHGPLTALMLLEAIKFDKPTAQIAHFEYRARNPIIVNRLMTINGVWVDEITATVWCEDDAGVVGMTGTVKLREPATNE